ncbi:MAG: phosphatidylglycerophosphatase A [Clostridia bacterium]|nr:phosphatidylglycerophosphatase A [Clostridia bacterium]
MKRLVKVISSGLGLGYCPVASGTIGSLLGIPLVLIYPNSAILALLLIIIGIWSSTKGEALFGEKDSPKIVIDEVAGYYLAMFGLPLTWPYFVGAFLIFRILDVIKPGAIRKLQNLKGGWGVMADDLAAGILTNIILRLFNL